MKAFAFVITVLLMAVSFSARADGPLDDYDEGAPPAIARTLSPNEYVINADGATKIQTTGMSDVARAYRNGLIAGRQEEMMRQRRIIAEQNGHNDATTDYLQANPPLPQYAPQPPVQYVQQPQPQPMYAPLPPQQYVLRTPSSAAYRRERGHPVLSYAADRSMAARLSTRVAASAKIAVGEIEGVSAKA